MKNGFDKVLTSAPANATAAKVTARGEHWEPQGQIPPGLKHWKAPPPLRAFVGDPDLGAIDFTGKKFGRFTVLGLWAESASDGARWICRCVCGDYEARSAKSIKSALAGFAQPNTLSFQCYYCNSWQTAQRTYKKKGAKPLSAFTGATPRVIEARKPEDIIADKIAQILKCDDDCHEAAIDLIRTLNRKGYRITRDPNVESAAS